MNDIEEGTPPSQVIPGFIRTLVPLVAGYVVAIAADLGWDISAPTANAIAFIGTLAYYLFMRTRELKGKNWATRALGSKSSPMFTKVD